MDGLPCSVYSCSLTHSLSLSPIQTYSLEYFISLSSQPGTLTTLIIGMYPNSLNKTIQLHSLKKVVSQLSSQSIENSI